jgi:mannose-6-phosphate isomerase-like protein (cupin superfamily)
MASEVSEPEKGEGYTVASLGGLGDGPGFRKIRTGLDVEHFGVNAVVLPPGVESRPHFHERQEELYFVHAGAVEIEFGDGSVHRLGPGGMARVAPSTHRKLRSVGDEDAVCLIVGAEGGYVGRDGRPAEFG